MRETPFAPRTASGRRTGRSRAIVLTFGLTFLGATAPAWAAGKPVAKGPWVQRVTSTSASIRIEVDPAAPVSVEIAGRVVESREARALHTVEVAGLEPGTRQPYTVRVGETVKSGVFVTAPREDSEAPFRFLVYGDNRSDDAAHASVVRAMTPAASDFLVHTGDFVEDGGSLENWQTFFDIEAPLLQSRCLYSAVGNHELTDGAGVAYARYFGPNDRFVTASGRKPVMKPEHLDGTFRWGSARFFLVNSMVSYRPSNAPPAPGTFGDRAWLEKVLADADAEPNLQWRILVLHHGPWSSGPHGGNAQLHEGGVIALLKRHKVDLVLSGHDHLYDRGIGEGLPYVVTGGGGAPVYKVKAPIAESRKTESVRHFVEVSVSPKELRLAALRVDGSTIERCGIIKGTAGWDCDVGAPPPGPPREKCGCEIVGARVAGGARWIVMLFALLGLRILRQWHASSPPRSSSSHARPVSR